MLTVNEVSKRTGVSVRALHHYDAIGLLTPAKVTDAGYRLYDHAALRRLQNILMFRELQFPLKEIRRILDSPSFQPQEAIAQQIKLLELQRKHIDDLISLARDIQKKGAKIMDFQAFQKEELEAYAKEVKERWGSTGAYREFEQKTAGTSKENLQQTAEELMSLFSELGSMRTLSPAEWAVQEKIGELQAFITEHYYTCTDQILLGLSQLYVGDERFRHNIDKAGGEGTAEFARQAIEAFANRKSER